MTSTMLLVTAAGLVALLLALPSTFAAVAVRVDAPRTGLRRSVEARRRPVRLER